MNRSGNKPFDAPDTDDTVPEIVALVHIAQ
jgi:hypothetical protein